MIKFSRYLRRPFDVLLHSCLEAAGESSKVIKKIIFFFGGFLIAYNVSCLAFISCRQIQILVGQCFVIELGEFRLQLAIYLN